jgi:hypothetical protein
VSPNRALMNRDADMLASFVSRLEHSVPTRISRHRASCCDSAEAWFRLMSRSRPSNNDALAWIHQRWRWGLMTWPQYWCQLVTAPRIDCGAFAALGRAAVVTRGGRAMAVQMVERFDRSTTEGWEANCIRALGLSGWIFGPFAYHEAVALEREDGVAVCDPTDGRMVGHTGDGYGAVVAIRICASAERCFRWRREVLRGGEWRLLGTSMPI